MRVKCKELHEEADFEARVAMGLARYGFTRDAHKVADSDPESEGEAAAPAYKDDGDDWLYDTDFSNPAAVEKLLPPPAPPQEHMPPTDADSATRQLVSFLPNSGTPTALRAILAARADPNVDICDGDPLPLLPELLSELLRIRGDPNRIARRSSMSPLMNTISLARPQHLKEMRDVLLEYGADCGVEERRRYKGRYESDQHDPTYLREFHRSALSLHNGGAYRPEDTLA